MAKNQSIAATISATTAVREGNVISWEGVDIKGREAADKKATEGREFRNDLISGYAEALGTAAKPVFAEDKEVDFLTTHVPFGGVDYAVSVHREFHLPVEDEVKVVPNHITVVSDDNFGDELNAVRTRLNEEAPEAITADE
jgi:hypothetical protein